MKEFFRVVVPIALSMNSNQSVRQSFNHSVSLFSWQSILFSVSNSQQFFKQSIIQSITITVTVSQSISHSLPALPAINRLFHHQSNVSQLSYIN